MDRLLATRTDFLLGRWLESAKAWGQTPAEKALYEQNARDLITLWGDKNSPLHDYSNRQWSGLLRSFYKPRWQQFFDKAQASLKTGQPIDLTAFDHQMRDWEWNWVNSHEPYPTTPTGSSVDVAKVLYKQYRPLVSK
jgi:alpha-N-acetylglucosaminidase